LMITIKRNNWTTQVLPSKYESSPAGASDLRREDLAPRASRHDRGGTEFLFFTSGPFQGARFFFPNSHLCIAKIARRRLIPPRVCQGRYQSHKKAEPFLSSCGGTEKRASQPR
jgi:hypothetical protein